MKKHLRILGVAVSLATVVLGQDQSVNGTLNAHALKLTGYLHIADGNKWDTNKYTHLKDRTFFYSGGGRKGMFISSYGPLADIRLQTGGNWLNNPSSSIILTNQGRVGIGTIEPNQKFEVYNNNGRDVIAQFTTKEGALTLASAGKTTTNPTYGNYIASFDRFGKYRDFGIKTKAGVPPFIFKTNGKMGIGTTDPKQTLDIVGTLGFNGININNKPSNYWRIYHNASSTEDYGLQIHYNTENKISFHRDKFLFNGGNVGIGTHSPDEALTVNGTVHAKEVKIDLAGALAPDYVFEKYYEGASELKADYTMPTLEEVAQFTKEYKHLPNIPSAQELEENGMHLKEMTRLLLQKIEELTLYTIEQQKEIRVLKTEIMELKSSNK